MNDTQDTQGQTQTRKREEHLSKDSQWRSFPKVPHLLQYVSNGNYYARIKANGKIIRESLKTSVWTTAKLKLTDVVKKHQEARGTLISPKFSEAVEVFKRELESDSRIKPQSKQCFVPLLFVFPPARSRLIARISAATNGEDFA